MKSLLLIIDPQIDFCDPNRGALYVPGADSDMERLAALVGRLGNSIDSILVTLDSHHVMHIAHAIYWRSPAGGHPAPLTRITAADVDKRVWIPSLPENARRAQDYVQRLEAGGRYTLCIWPPHCLIGGQGHAVSPALFDALVKWEQGLRVVKYFWKGSNLHTEHYSALRAEVPDREDSGTQINEKILNACAQADQVYVAGEAGSHCVANTLRDIAAIRGPEAVRKLVLLTDAISPVAGFEKLQDAMIFDLTKLGMRLATTKDLTL